MKWLFIAETMNNSSLRIRFSLATAAIIEFSVKLVANHIDPQCRNNVGIYRKSPTIRNSRDYINGY